MTVKRDYVKERVHLMQKKSNGKIIASLKSLMNF